jgi:N-acyl-D-aspartate/D-glutamate deacylase
MHDLLIRGATIFDGTGKPRFEADLAVQGGRIAAIGSELGAARETVDARGLALAPGIIDGHTHYDAQITWDPTADPSLPLGVTTVVIGNCGFTIAPCRPGDRDLTMRNLTHVEGMSLDALRAGIRWDFESFPEYLDMIERQGAGPNVVAFVGHSSIRTYVLGEDASKRVATDAEIAQMAAIVREGMKAGAVGFATSTNEPHNGENGVPMPSRLADDREMHALVKAMAESGRGVFMLTKGMVTPVSSLEEIAAASGRPVLIAALLHNGTNPTRVFEIIDEIRAARARGRQLIGQVSCTPLTMDFTLKSPYCFEGLAEWKPAMEAEGEALKRVYADPSFRASVKAGLERRQGTSAFNGEWDKVHVVEVAKAENRALEQRSIEEIGKAQGKHPLDTILDLGLAEGLETQFTSLLLNSDEQAVARLVSDPDNHVALSDAGAHLTFLCDAAYGLHLMGYWSRDREALSLEEAVRKLSGQPAAIFGIKDRGTLEPGKAADLLLFDPATVNRGPKQRVFDLPSGAPRLTTSAEGLYGVWVNGVRVVDQDGTRNAGTPGKLLRNFAG